MTSTAGPVQQLKALALGFDNSGITCMFITYVNKQYPTNFVPRTFDSYCELVCPGVLLELWDIGGAEEERRPLAYHRTNACILCFDVTRRDLFEKIESYWYSELRHHCPDVPIILTATKIDLRETEENYVTTEEGEALAAKTRSHYAEISSLKGIGLDELFERVTAIARQHHFAGRKDIPNKDLKHKKCDLL